MPGPVLLRGLPAVHQRRFPSLEDEKVSVSMSPPPLSSSPSPSSSSSLDPNPISVAQKRSRQEVHRLVQEVMAMGVQPHTSARFSTHRIDDLEKGSLSTSCSSMSTNIGLNERIRKQDARECSTPAEGLRNYDDQIICVEVAGRRAQWEYKLKQQPGKKGGTVFNVIDSKLDRNPFNDLMGFIRSCVIPDGYPESVSPSYAPYMRWRAMKYLFGGAMSVFTTRSLLHAVGVSRHGAASTAMAVNWVIKDGAGRVGKLLFARHGKKFDYDMKQLRFTGDLLMELGAAVELATVAAPHLFLPLACAANIAKNVAAVASTSTRAPIYKAFAQGENIGDVTAKGECISNIADLLGTGLGIFISKKNPSLLVTFAVLSCGYLCCSYQEIKSVRLPTLNRARFKVAVQSFLETGKVPSLLEGNRKESIFTPPWVREKPFALGARVNEAFQSPYKFLDLLSLFQKENYLVTYNPTKRQAFAILKEKASSDDVLRATFHAQVLESIVQKSLLPRQVPGNAAVDIVADFQKSHRSEMGIEAAIRESCKHVPRLFESFRNQAISQGWVMGESLLNPGIARLCSQREG